MNDADVQRCCEEKKVRVRKHLVLSWPSAELPHCAMVVREDVGSLTERRREGKSASVQVITFGGDLIRKHRCSSRRVISAKIVCADSMTIARHCSVLTLNNPHCI